MDKVVYRKYPNGEIIALFPQIAANVYGWLCHSYMHTGQHGAAEINFIIRKTLPATPNEYAELQAELEQIGYNPQPAKKCTHKDYKIRKKQYR